MAIRRNIWCFTRQKYEQGRETKEVGAVGGKESSEDFTVRLDYSSLPDPGMCLTRQMVQQSDMRYDHTQATSKSYSPYLCIQPHDDS